MKGFSVKYWRSQSQFSIWELSAWGPSKTGGPDGIGSKNKWLVNFIGRTWRWEDWTTLPHGLAFQTKQHHKSNGRETEI